MVVGIAIPQLVEHGRVRSDIALPGPGSARPHPSSTISAARAAGSELGPDSTVTYSAAATIAANDSASRLAPPTSAPSTSGSASSSAALSGLTLPP